jgi:hypothetical protein
MAVNSVGAGNNAVHAAQVKEQKSGDAGAAANKKQGAAGGNAKVTLSSRNADKSPAAADKARAASTVAQTAGRSKATNNSAAAKYNNAGTNSSTVGKTISKLV